MDFWDKSGLTVVDRWAQLSLADNIRDIAVFVQTKDKSRQDLKEG
jgi:transposase